MGKCIKKISLLGVLLLSIGFGTKKLAAAIPSVTDKGVVGSKYTIFFPHERAYLSRDGALAIKVESPLKIDQSGTYFLSVIDGKQRGRSIQFTIEPREAKTRFKVNKQEELEEIFKSAFERFEPEITLEFEYGTFNIHELNTLCLYYAEKALAHYPILTFDSFSLSSKGGEHPIVKIEISYPLENREELLKLKKETEQKIREIIQNEALFSMSEIEKEKALYTYTIEQIEYPEEMNTLHYTLSGALIKGEGGCEGYAKSIQYLLNSIGIPTYYVRGTADKEEHAWNIVSLEEGYYHVDATWGDGENPLEYFNQLDEKMEKTHTWEKSSYPACEKP